MEGPSKKIIPAQEILSCEGCKYLKMSLQLSHMKAFPAHMCTLDTPDWRGKPLYTDPITYTVKPGDWCPFPVNDP